ncbi:MAG: hypothetical protein FWG28_02180 [Clostridiales bacterium]|nr:hypothetical protein [Clostridiales bacterium]
MFKPVSKANRWMSAALALVFLFSIAVPAFVAWGVDESAGVVAEGGDAAPGGTEEPGEGDGSGEAGDEALEPDEGEAESGPGKAGDGSGAGAGLPMFAGINALAAALGEDNGLFEPLGGGMGIMALDGEIGLFAAGDANSDLANFITSVVVRDSSGTLMNDASYYYIGDTYEFTIDFTEHAGTDGQFEYDFDDFLTYQLPEYLKITSPVEGDIHVASSAAGAAPGATVKVGQYTIDTSGLVKVRFNDIDTAGYDIEENFIDHYTNAWFSLAIEADLISAPSGGRVVFGADAIVNIKVYVAPPDAAVVSVSKTGTPITGDKINYEVTITASGNTVKNIVFNDYPWIKKSSSGSNLTITNPDNANTAYTNFSYIIYDASGSPRTGSVEMSGGVWAPATGTGTTTGTTNFRTHYIYDFSAVELEPDEKIVVTYTLDVQKLMANNGLYTSDNAESLNYYLDVGNDVKVESNAVIASTFDPAGHHYSKSFAFTKVGSEGAAENTIDWIVTVGKSGPTEEPLNGGEIRDSLNVASTALTGSSNMPADSAIEITLVESGSISNIFTADKIPGFSFTGNEFRFTIPANLTSLVDKGGTSRTIGNVYQVIVKYASTYSTPASGTSPVIFGNTAYYHELSVSDTVSVTPPARKEETTVTKSGGWTQSEYDNKITWQCDIGGGIEELTSSVISDKLAATVGEDDISGFMGMPDKSKIKVVVYGAPTYHDTVNNVMKFQTSDIIFNDYANHASINSSFLIDGDNKGFSFKIPNLGKDIYRVYIEYTTDILLPIPDDAGDFVYKNEVDLDGGKSDYDEFVIQRPAAGEKSYKTGDWNGEDIEWEIKIGDGTVPLNLITITDTLSSDLASIIELPNANKINIDIYGRPSGVLGGKADFKDRDLIGEYTADVFTSDFTINGDKSEFVFTVPENNPNGGTFGAIYQIIITYATPLSILPDINEDFDYVNELALSNEIVIDPVYVTIPGPIPGKFIHKWGVPVGLSVRDGIEWTSSIGNGIEPLNGQTITDTLIVIGDGTMKFPVQEDIQIRFYGKPTDIADGNVAVFHPVDDLLCTFDVDGGDYDELEFEFIGDDEFQFTVPKSISDGGSYDIYGIVITYTTPVEGPKFGNTSAATYSNRIGIDLDIEYDTSTEESGSHTVSVPTLKTSFGSKTGVKDGVVDNKIKWTSIIGNGSLPLNGQTITDTISGGGKATLLNDSDFKIKLYGSPSSIDSSNVVDFCEDDLIGEFTPTHFGADFAIKDNGFTFDVPTTNPITSDVFENIYQIQIEYSTTVDKPVLGDSNFDYVNKVEVGGKTITSNTVHYAAPQPMPPSIIKSSKMIKISSGDYAGQVGMEYTVEITVPEGNKGKRFYLQDVLNVNGGSNIGVKNIPLNFSAEISPAPSGSEPAFDASSYNLVTSAASNTYYVYFPKTATSSTTTAWQYSTVKTLTISYVIPFDRTETTGTRTIEELLKASSANRLTNTATVQGASGVNYTTNNAWPVHKSVRAVAGDPTLFEYTVTINGNSAYRQSLFEADESAVFIDDYDPALMYVPKSFYAINYVGATSITYGPYDGTGIIGGGSVTEMRSGDPPALAVNESSGSLTVHLEELNQLKWSSNLAASSVQGIPDNETWYADSNMIEIHYQLRIKDPSAIEERFTVLKNSASITSNVQSLIFSNNASVTYEMKPLGKSWKNNTGSSVIGAEIIINPQGARLAPVGDGRYTAIDTMSDNLVIFLGSVKFYTQAKVGGTWNGVWGTPFDAATIPGALWSVAIDPIDSNVTYFVLPDEQPIKITYDAFVTEQPGVTSTLMNSIEVCGYYQKADDLSYKVINASAGAGAHRVDLTLQKTDIDTGVGLPGAEFELYIGFPPDYDKFDNTAGSVLKVEDSSGVEYAFYRVEDLANPIVTGANGKATISSGWLVGSHNFVYLLVEKIAPSGDYLLPRGSDAYTFFTLAGNKMTSAQLTALNAAFGTVYRNVTDTVPVANSVATCAAAIDGTKALEGIEETNKPFTFNAVQVTGMESDTPVAGGLSGSSIITGAGGFSIEIDGLLKSGSPYYFKVSEDQTGNGLRGWIYDEHAFWVTVTVAEQADGTLGATVSSPSGSTTFTNQYEKEDFGPGNAHIRFVKIIKGRVSTEEIFTFDLVEVADPEGGAKSNPFTKRVTTTGSLTQDVGQLLEVEINDLAPGKYYFKITENSDSKKSGWTYSTLTYIVEVIVYDDLVVDINYPDVYSSGYPPEFTNTYKAPSDPPDDPPGGGDPPPGVTPPGGTDPPPGGNEGDDDADGDGDADGDADGDGDGDGDGGRGGGDEEEPYVEGGHFHDVPPLAHRQGDNIVWVDDEHYIEFDEDGVPLGEWHWDDELEEWIFDEFPPLGALPRTGAVAIPAALSLMLGGSSLGAMTALRKNAKKRGAHNKIKGASH